LPFMASLVFEMISIIVSSRSTMIHIIFCPLLPCQSAILYHDASETWDGNKTLLARYKICDNMPNFTLPIVVLSSSV